MQQQFKLPADKYHKSILTVMNCFLHLSEIEIEILSEILKNNITVINTDSRKILQKSLNKKEHNLNNYIKRLKDKKVLLESNEGYIVDPGIIESVSDKKVLIEFDVY